MYRGDERKEEIKQQRETRELKYGWRLKKRENGDKREEREK